MSELYVCEKAVECTNTPCVHRVPHEENAGCATIGPCAWYNINVVCVEVKDEKLGK